MWDLDTQSCVQTVVGHRCEIWSVAVLPRVTSDGTPSPIVVTGASDELIRGYRLTSSTSAPSSSSAKDQIDGVSDATEETGQSILEHYGSLERQQVGGHDKCTGLFFNPAGNLLAAQSSGKIVEVCSVINFVCSFAHL